MPPDPVLATEIARVQRLEKEGLLRWDQAADLIEKLHGQWDMWYVDPSALGVFGLARLPMLDLRALYFLVCQPDQSRLRQPGLVLLPSTREQLVAAILDRAS